MNEKGYVPTPKGEIVRECLDTALCDLDGSLAELGEVLDFEIKSGVRTEVWNDLDDNWRAAVESLFAAKNLFKEYVNLNQRAAS